MANVSVLFLGRFRAFKFDRIEQRIYHGCERGKGGHPELLLLLLNTLKAQILISVISLL